MRGPTFFLLKNKIKNFNNADVIYSLDDFKTTWDGRVTNITEHIVTIRPSNKVANQNDHLYFRLIKQNKRLDLEADIDIKDDGDIEINIHKVSLLKSFFNKRFKKSA